MKELNLLIPHTQYALIPLIHREGVVLEEKGGEENSLVRCKMPSRLIDRFKAFIV